MKKNVVRNLAIALILACVLVIVKNITILPWWSFVIPVMILGMILKLKKFTFPSFLIGFITGFLVWFFADLYFDIRLSGNVLQTLGNILPVHKTVIMCMSGLIGGLLTGLALYTGYLMMNTRKTVIEKSVW